VAWELTDETVVQCECKPALDKAFAVDPQPLYKFLNFLESNGHVRTKVHMHSVKRREDVPGRYEVSPTEQAAMEVKTSDGAGAGSLKVTLQNIGNFVDMKFLKDAKHVKIIHKLVFDSASNKITCSYPVVLLTSSVRLKAGEVVKLAG